MQHLIDNHQTIVETFKNHPILAFFVAIVGTATGYAVGEIHLPLLLMQLIQIFAWVAAGLAGLVPVINVVKKELIPWIKSFKKK